MKFAETLSAHITPEWRKQYIQYEEMKAMVYAAIQEAPAAEAADGEELQRYFASFDEKFFTFCDKGASTMNPRGRQTCRLRVLRILFLPLAYHSCLSLPANFSQPGAHS